MFDKMKTHLLYSRYINTNAIKEKNIGCDLHMEHTNIYGMEGYNTSHFKASPTERSGANISEEVVQKYGKILEPLK